MLNQMEVLNQIFNAYPQNINSLGQYFSYFHQLSSY